MGLTALMSRAVYNTKNIENISYPQKTTLLTLLTGAVVALMDRASDL